MADKVRHMHSHTHIVQAVTSHTFVISSKSIYRIAGNYRLEKIFAFFAQARRGRMIINQLFYLVFKIS